MHYWLGHIKQEVGQLTQAWMPADLDCIPLQEWNPADGQMVAAEDGDGEVGLVDRNT